MLFAICKMSVNNSCNSNFFIILCFDCIRCMSFIVRFICDTVHYKVDSQSGVIHDETVDREFTT